MQNLSQLEVGLKLKSHGHEVSFEEPSINGRYIDILASSERSDLVIKIVSLEESAELRYSGFSADIKDKAKAKMLEKLDQIADYPKDKPYPILLVFNMTKMNRKGKRHKMK